MPVPHSTGSDRASEAQGDALRSKHAPTGPVLQRCTPHARSPLYRQRPRIRGTGRRPPQQTRTHRPSAPAMHAACPFPTLPAATAHPRHRATPSAANTHPQAQCSSDARRMPVPHSTGSDRASEAQGDALRSKHAPTGPVLQRCTPHARSPLYRQRLQIRCSEAPRDRATRGDQLEPLLLVKHLCLLITAL
ncbi:hypothetical protein NDU88_000122 [Pleurodeles waltl]|uniref:Uncharacterized protein n=1 Tax=Pleurodeles waltl TaxID=8319 RepID=A0AAV7ML38_PLEWA|nr:hypothetical protein NDU88_000122 [Pleurodeles waltl]